MGQQGTHEVIGEGLFRRLVCGRRGIPPGIGVVDGLAEAGEAVRCDHGHVELQGIEHQVRGLFVEGGIVHIGQQAHHLKLLAAYGDGVAYLYADIVRVHAVDGDLVCRRREAAVQQAGQVDVLCGGVDAEGAVALTVVVVILRFIAEEVFVQGHGDGLEIRVIQLVFFLRVGVLFIDLGLELILGLLIG